MIDLEIINNNKQLVITFVDKKYTTILSNWISFLNEYENYQVLIFTTDKKASKFCKQNNLLFYDISKIHNSHNLGIVKTRLIVFHYLLNNGFGFIHSDLDAVWLSDPKKYLQDNSDLIISQGTIWPYESFLKNDFVACMGFFKVSSNSRTIEFFKKADELSLKNKNRVSDQKTINFLLDNFVNWESVENSYFIKYKNNKIKCFENPLYANGKLSVTLLQHSLFPRLLLPEKNKEINIKVAHPIEAEGSQFIKLIKFRKLGLIHKTFNKKYFYKILVLEFPNFLLYYLTKFKNNLKYYIKN
jgi:hypothetical protein